LQVLTTSSRADSFSRLCSIGVVLLRVIREEEPPRPSTRLTTTGELPSIAAQRGLGPKHLAKMVHGELDWIVMKPLEKDRTQRCETANGIARDVELYLHGGPVLACPPSAAYRVRKFPRCNKTLLAATAAVVLALAVGLVVSAVGFVQADRQRALACQRARRIDPAAGAES
jgi:hypothetical protein